MTFDEIAAIGLTYPGVTQNVTHGTPSLKVGSKFLLREHEPGILAIGRPSIDERDMLLESDPDLFFITDHFRGYSYILVRMDKLDAARFKALFETIWREKALKRHLLAHDASSSANS